MLEVLCDLSQELYWYVLVVTVLIGTVIPSLALSALMMPVHHIVSVSVRSSNEHEALPDKRVSVATVRGLPFTMSSLDTVVRRGGVQVP